MLGLFKKKANPREEICALLGEIELPMFPAIVTTALDKIRDEDVSFFELGDLLVSDPGLTVRLLGTVNSAAFGLRQSVRSVHHAVSLLGRNQLESVLISIAARQAVPGTAGRGFETRRFWTTAAQRAVTARRLADFIDPSTTSESFTASLLQDLAVPLLSQHKGDPYADVLEAWHDGNDDLADLERHEFDWDHATIAGLLCLEWKLPEKIAESIATHHTRPQGIESLPSVAIVAHFREVDEKPGFERAIEEAADRFQIPSDTTARIIQESSEAAQEIAQLFV